METLVDSTVSVDRSARTFIVMNPVAGATDCESARDTVTEYLTSHGVEHEFYFTKKDDNIPEIVSRAVDSGFKRIAAIGGDGTVSLTAAGLLNRQTPLAILPAGSGNILARDLDIPLGLPEALDVLVHSPHIRTIDAMQAGEKTYFLNISAGISSLTLLKTNRSDKRKFGMMAYFIRGFENLSKFRPQLFKVMIDGVEHRLSALEVLIANASFLGINPYSTDRAIVPDDGVLDVCVVLARNLGDLPALAVELVTGSRTPLPKVECMPAEREIVLDSFRRLPIQADGDLAGYTPMRIKVMPHALQVIVP